MGWAGPVAHMEDRRNVYMIFIVGHTRKRDLSVNLSVEGGNIKIGVQEIRLGGVD